MTKTTPAEGQKKQATVSAEVAPGAVVRDTPAAASIARAAPPEEPAARSESPEVQEVIEEIHRRTVRAAGVGEARPSSAAAVDALPPVPRKPATLVEAVPGFGKAPARTANPFVAPKTAVRPTTPMRSGVAAADGWEAAMRSTQQAEAERRNSVVKAAVATLDRPEPPRTLGQPDFHGEPLVGDFTYAWAQYPRNVSTFNFADVVALGRTDGDVVSTGTTGGVAWARAARGRFLGHLRGAYQVPLMLFSDRTFVREAIEAVYLEAMDAYLLGKSDVAAIVDARFWKFDLALPSKQGERTAYDRIRTEWALCRGFERVIAFEDYDALRADDSEIALFEVCTGKLEKQTRLRLSLDHFPRLPEVIRKARGQPGLCIRMPLILRYLGTEVQVPHQYSVQPDRLAWATKIEYVKALASGLYLDYVCAQMVWIVTTDCLDFLNGYASLPPLKREVPDVGDLNLDDMVKRLCDARLLGREYLFERMDFPAQEMSRWAILEADRYVVAADYKGGFHGGKPLVGSRRRGSRGAGGSGHSGYYGGFAPTIDRRASNRYARLESCAADADVRGTPDVGPLLYPFDIRENGWSFRELIALATGRARQADERIRELERELADVNYRLSHPPTGGYDQMYTAIPAPNAPAQRGYFTDPYARAGNPYPSSGYGGQPSQGGSEPKRFRYESAPYGNSRDHCSGDQQGAGSGAAPGGSAPRGSSYYHYQ